MTDATAQLLLQPPRTADRLLGALAVAVVAGLVALFLAIAAVPSSRPAAAPREALVLSATGRPQAALARARAAAGPGVAVRVPRTADETALDLRYLAASGYARVVAVGPAARAAVREVAAAYPRTRFVVR